MKETRQLRYFVAVAEELHFGRAADRLGVAQPSLSRAVRGLEGVLGTQLFERSTRHVGLTSAGQSLLIDARAALDAVSSAGRRAVRAGLARPSLAIASKPDGDAGVLCEVLAALQREAPGVEAEPLFAAAGDQAATMLRDGRADVALVPAPFDERGLDYEEVPAEARVVALPATHALAAQEVIGLADALVQVTVSWPQADDVLAAFYRGRDPDSLAQAAPFPIPPPAEDLAQALRLVELGQAVAFLPASIAAGRSIPRLSAGCETLTNDVQQPSTRIDHIVGGIHRIATWVPEAGISFNQFLIDDERPALVHTGMHELYEAVRGAVAEVLDPARLEFVALLHFEADECGGMDRFLAAAPESTLVGSALSAGINLAGWDYRGKVQGVSGGEVLDLGAHRLRFLETPHVHHWDSMMIVEETTGSVFPADLYIQPGEQPATVGEDLGREMCSYYRELGIFAHEEPVRAVLDRIEALEPEWMHAMHGGSLTRDAIPRYTRALREQRFAFDGRLLGREVLR